MALDGRFFSIIPSGELYTRRSLYRESGRDSGGYERFSVMGENGTLTVGGRILKWMSSVMCR